MATGKTVREDAQLFDRLRRSVRATIGVDMEGAVMGDLGARFQKRAIVVKAVTDHADSDKDDSFRGFACRASAVFLVEFLKKHLDPKEPTAAPDLPRAEEKSAPPRGPLPSYPDERTRGLGEQLAFAYERKQRLQRGGFSTGEVDRKILALRRELREGGQLLAGDSLADGRYLLLNRLGKGGFAVVWEAQDTARGERVAVKPANILLDSSGGALLTDFDLVAAADTTGGTRTGALGTFLYAAPESMDRPEDADARADVYSLGMTSIFGLFGGELPKALFRSAEKFIDGLSCRESVKAVLKRAVDWDMDTRFASAAAFCEALHAARTPMSHVAPLPVVLGAARGLEFFEGAWADRENGSNYYGRIIRRKLLIGYCYGGNHELTGEFYSCMLVRHKLVMRFQWFDRSFEGYAFVRIVEPNILKGGWWYSQDVPPYVVHDVSRLDETVSGMAPWVLERQHGAARWPEWVEDYFISVQKRM